MIRALSSFVGGLTLIVVGGVAALVSVLRATATAVHIPRRDNRPLIDKLADVKVQAQAMRIANSR